MRPNLSDISHIVSISFRLSLRDSLDEEGPGSSLTRSNPVKKIFCVVVFSLLLDLEYLLWAEILNTYISLNMVFDYECLAFSIDPFVGMSTKSIHVAVAV
jgi:hypothetical protein